MGQPGVMYQNCNSNTFYPVDLYLVEGRRFFFNTPEEQYFLQTFFPDKALLNNQIAHWPLNDGAVSYTSAARSFEEMTRKLNEAVRQYDSTQCVNAAVTSTQFLNAAFGGLKGGDFACYNKNLLQLDYTTCSTTDLAGGEQLVTTNTIVKEEEFKPLISNPVQSEDTIARQNMRTKWTVDRPVDEEAFIIGITSAIVIAIVLLIVGTVNCILYYCCWRGRVSSRIEKSTGINKSVEEETEQKELPVIA